MDTRLTAIEFLSQVFVKSGYSHILYNTSWECEIEAMESYAAQEVKIAIAEKDNLIEAKNIALDMLNKRIQDTDKEVERLKEGLRSIIHSIDYDGLNASLPKPRKIAERLLKTN